MAETADLDALVTRNIGDIEAALGHARDLGRSLIEQIEAILIEELGQEWHVESDPDDDAPVWLSHRSWLDEGTPSRKSAYRLQFNEHEGPGGEVDETWFTTMLGTGPNGATLRVYFWANSFSAKRRWARLVEQELDLIARLESAGFRIDSDKWLYLPFLLSAEQLACGFESGDMQPALQPVRALAAILKESTTDLGTLVKRDQAFD